MASIKQMITDQGGRPFKIHGSDEGFQEVGIPDILACLYGMFVGIEAKQPGAKLRPAQRVVLHEIYDAGGVAAVLETVGQASLLLSNLQKRGGVATTSNGICFDRGEFRRGKCKFR